MLSPFNRRYTVKRRSSAVSALPDELANRVRAEENAVTLAPHHAHDLLGMSDHSASTNKIMHTTPVATLDPVEVARCFDSLNTGVPRACLQRLNAELSRAGLVFSSNEGEIVPTAEMNRYIEDVLVQLQQDSLRAIIAIGVVPIAFMRDDATGGVIPYVPAPKTYTIAVGSLRGVRYYQLHWLPAHHGASLVRVTQSGPNGPHGNDRLVSGRQIGERRFGVPDPSVVVLSGFNNDPDINGRICSLASAFIYSAVEPSSAFISLAVTAETISTKPPIARQYSGKEDAAAHEALRGTEYVGEGVLDAVGEGEARRINNGFLRTERQIADYQRQNREISGYMATLAGVPVETTSSTVQSITRPSGSVGATDADGNPALQQNEIALPEGWQVANLQLPQARHDLVPLLEHFDEKIFMQFLIPAQSLNANARLAADADMAEKTLDVVVSEWKKAIARILTFAHDSTFLQPDTEAAIASTLKRKRASGGPAPSANDILRLTVTDEELDRIIDQVGSVRVAYRQKPPTKGENLDRLHARGIISWATYAQASAQVQGIDPALVNETDPLPADAARVTGMPEYLGYLQWKAEQQRETHRHGEAQAALAQQAEQAEQAAAAGPPAKKKN